MDDKTFSVNQPTVISFSGGRTSGYMLWRFLDANGGLPDECFVTFANTGKEMPQTLDFVRDCSEKWSVPITWLEYRSAKSFTEVTYESASRNGEPFDDLILDKRYLPNPCARFCTSELKVIPIEKHMKGLGFDDFDTAVGIRADEPRRVAKMRSKEGYRVPLADKQIVVEDVVRFWREQSFNLNLPEHGDYSNCDLCFLKRLSLKKSIVAESPSRALWWANHERSLNARFRMDHPSYQELHDRSDEQADLFGSDEQTIACFCGD